MGTKTGIVNMHFTMSAMEHIRDQQLAADYAARPEEQKSQPVHYFVVERKAKRGKDKWIFVQNFTGTEERANELFAKHYQNSTRHTYRLRLVQSY